MDIKQRLKQVLVEDLNLEDMTPEQIRDDEILFSQGIGLDSLDAVELVVVVKKHFGVHKGFTRPSTAIVLGSKGPLIRPTS